MFFFPQLLLPKFFVKERLEMIEEVFLDLHSSGENTLDKQEIAPFIYYSIASAFEVPLYHSFIVH